MYVTYFIVPYGYAKYLIQKSSLPVALGHCARLACDFEIKRPPGTVKESVALANVTGWVLPCNSLPTQPQVIYPLGTTLWPLVK